MSTFDKILACIAAVGLGLLGVYTAQVIWTLYFPLPTFVKVVVIVVWLMMCSSMVQQYLQDQEDDTDADL